MMIGFLNLPNVVLLPLEHQRRERERSKKSNIPFRAKKRRFFFLKAIDSIPSLSLSFTRTHTLAHTHAHIHTHSCKQSLTETYTRTHTHIHTEKEGLYYSTLSGDRFKFKRTLRLFRLQQTALQILNKKLFIQLETSLNKMAKIPRKVCS